MKGQRAAEETKVESIDSAEAGEVGRTSGWTGETLSLED